MKIGRAACSSNRKGKSDRDRDNSDSDSDVANINKALILIVSGISPD